MNQTFSLNGPMLPQAEGERPKRLVILAHGLGTNGEDLIGLAPHYQRVLPDAIFISPNAPFDFDATPPGAGAFQWFSLRDHSHEERLRGVRAAGPILDRFIDELLAAFDLDESRMALVGFSQGTMMSLWVGLRRARPPAGILGYSGMLIGGDLLETEMKGKPPVRLIHGEEDAVLPHAFLTEAHEGLKRLGVPVEAFSRRGLGHGIDEEGIRLGQEFLKRIFFRHGD